MIERAVFAAQAAGYRVILTHPERCVAVQRDPNTLLPLVERGAYMQLTAAALTGDQGEHLRATAEALLTHGMAQLLASDAHGLPPRRAPILSAGPLSRRRASRRPGGRCAGLNNASGDLKRRAAACAIATPDRVVEMATVAVGGAGDGRQEARD